MGHGQNQNMWNIPTKNSDEQNKNCRKHFLLLFLLFCLHIGLAVGLQIFKIKRLHKNI